MRQVLERSSLDDKFRQRSLLLLSTICKACAIIPASYILREKIHFERVYHRGRLADVSKGEYSGFPVAIKRLSANQGDYDRVFKVLSMDSMHICHLALPSGCVERLLDGNG